MIDMANNCFHSKRLERVFALTFEPRFNTRLVGGYDEPSYLPASDQCHYHRLCYREDYFASALHEVAHWCIAGERRRSMEDFGYWYIPGARNQSAQIEFEKMESKPQALECLFSLACNFPFKMSVDNFALDNRPSYYFCAQLAKHIVEYARCSMPPRAAAFIQALQKEFATQCSTQQFLDHVMSEAEKVRPQAHIQQEASF